MLQMSTMQRLVMSPVVFESNPPSLFNVHQLYLYDVAHQIRSNRESKAYQLLAQLSSLLLHTVSLSITFTGRDTLKASPPSRSELMEVAVPDPAHMSD